MLLKFRGTRKTKNLDSNISSTMIYLENVKKLNAKCLVSKSQKGPQVPLGGGPRWKIINSKQLFITIPLSILTSNLHS